VIKAASREVQVSRIIALLKTGLTPREVHAKLKKEFPKDTMSVHFVIYHRRKQLSNCSGRVGRPANNSVSRKIISLRDRAVKLSIRKTAKMIKEPYSTTLEHIRRLGAKRNSIWKQPRVKFPSNEESGVRDSSSSV